MPEIPAETITLAPLLFSLPSLLVSLSVALTFLVLGYRTLTKESLKKEDQVVGGIFLIIGCAALSGAGGPLAAFDGILNTLCPIFGFGTLGYLAYKVAQKIPLKGQIWTLPGKGDVKIEKVLTGSTEQYYIFLSPRVIFTLDDKEDDLGILTFLAQATLKTKKIA